MDKILVEHYAKVNKTKKKAAIPAFQFKQMWAVKDPCIELHSAKHGDFALTFKDNGEVELTYWSPKLDPDAVNVRPTNIVLKP